MIKGTRFGIGCFMLFTFIAFFQACTQPRWKGTIIKEGDVTVIRNPKEPIYKTPILELQEELSLGGPDAQGDYAIGQIMDVVVDEVGAVYVLDYKNSHIIVLGFSKFLASASSWTSIMPARRTRTDTNTSSDTM